MTAQAHYYEVSDRAKTFRRLVRATDAGTASATMFRVLRAEKPRSWSKYTLTATHLNLAPAQVEGCEVIEANEVMI
jgi:hypothetical protein